jgi:hypothetical protein
MSERVLVIERWLGAHHGPLERIVLPREPRTDEEREWVECELRTRLVPGGVIVVSEYTPDQLEAIFHAALTAGDAQGVEAAIRVMVGVDPRRAERLYDDLKFAVRLAQVTGGTS